MLKYGTFDGKDDVIVVSGAFKASQKLPAKSGRFVIYDTSEAYWIPADDNAAAIGGYVEQSLTTSATAGGTVLPIIDPKGRIFELPYAATGAAATLTATVLKTLIGKFIDLYVDGDGIQYADNAANQAILRVEGGNVDNNTLYVSIKDSVVTQQS